MSRSTGPARMPPRSDEASDMAQRSHDALARAAKERALAAKGAPGADHDKKEDAAASVDSGGTALHHAVLAHEAAALVNLHAQAISVQNIRSLVHVLLDINAGNYTRWRDQILLVIGKYSLESHVLVDLPAPDFPDWTRMDCVVKSWIAGTISTDLAEMVIDRVATARTVWCALEDQFLSNRETRTLHLDVQFRNLVQGDLSITDFCRRLKSMAQQLPDLGEPVSDRTLTLNLLRGLNERFRDAGRHIRRGQPFPKFKNAVDELILEELTMAQQAPTPPTALLAAGKGAPSEAPPPPPSSSGTHPPGLPQRGLQLRGREFRRALQGPSPAGRQASLRRAVVVLRQRAVRGRQAGLRAQHRRCWWRHLAVLPPPVGRGHSDVAQPAALDAAPRRPDTAVAAASAAGPAGPGASLAGAQAHALQAAQAQALQQA